MEKNIQPQLKRAERVTQVASVKILAGRRAAQKRVVADTIEKFGQSGVSIAAKYRNIRRNEFGGRGYGSNDKY